MELASATDWQTKLVPFINRALSSDLDTIHPTDVELSLGQAIVAHRRARWAALTTPNLKPGRIFAPNSKVNPEQVVELQVHETGGLRLFFSRLSDTPPSHLDSPQPMIFDQATVGFTRRFLALAQGAAEEVDYLGNWALAIGATGLQGLPAYTQDLWGVENKPRYDEDQYARSTSVTWAELRATPAAVTRHLAGPLLRALGTENHYNAALTDPPPGSATSP